jgi:hypothetical protein
MPAGFADVLDVAMQPAGLTDAEQTLVRELEEQHMETLRAKRPGAGVKNFGAA